MRRRQFIGLMMVAPLCMSGCGKPLTERVQGTWLVLEQGQPRADGYALTLEADGKGTVSTGGDFTWKHYPNMLYVTLEFRDGGSITLKLITDDEGTILIAGEELPVRRKT